MAYNSYDTGVLISGTANYDHFAGFQAAPTFASSGTLTGYRGFASNLYVNAGTVTSAIGYYVFNPSGAGTITNNYGVYVDELTKGGTLNYGVFTAGATKSRFYNLVLGGGGASDTDLFDASGNPGLRGAALGADFAGLTLKDSTARLNLGYSNTSLAGTKMVPAVLQWSGGLTGGNAGSLEIGARGTVASAIAFFTSPDAGTTGLVEAARLTSTRNLLIGGTTDITGSGGLKVFGTTDYSGVNTGSFQSLGGGYFAKSLGVAGNLTVSGVGIESTDALSGAGAISVTAATTKLTTTAADALTLADGTNGQIKRIVMVADGGDGTLTPTTKTGFTTITFNDVGDSVTLQFHTTIGWMVVSNYGATVSP